MTKLKFDIDLVGYDTSLFEKNPIVVANNNVASFPIGRAVIASDKKSVEVELFDDSIPIPGDNLSPIYRSQLIGLSINSGKAIAEYK